MYGETVHWIKFSLMQSSPQREMSGGKILENSAVNPEKGLGLDTSSFLALWFCCKLLSYFACWKQLLEEWPTHYIMEIAARTASQKSIYGQIPLQAVYRDVAE